MHLWLTDTASLKAPMKKSASEKRVRWFIFRVILLIWSTFDCMVTFVLNKRSNKCQGNSLIIGLQAPENGFLVIQPLACCVLWWGGEPQNNDKNIYGNVSGTVERLKKKKERSFWVPVTGEVHLFYISVKRWQIQEDSETAVFLTDTLVWSSSELVSVL